MSAWKVHHPTLNFVYDNKRKKSQWPHGHFRGILKVQHSGPAYVTYGAVPILHLGWQNSKTTGNEVWTHWMVYFPSDITFILAQ